MDMRRRLSVSTVSGGGPHNSMGNEGDFGLVGALNNHVRVMDLGALTSEHSSPASSGSRGNSSLPARRGSFVATARENSPVPAFRNKQIDSQGEHIDPSSAWFSCTCRKGLKPESPNQDSWFVVNLPDQFAIYGVLDGHGVAGHDLSNFVKEKLPMFIVEDERFKSGRHDLPAVCKDAFAKIQSLIRDADENASLDAQLSGTTATICIHDYQSNELTFAHVGDCTAMVGQKTASGGLCAHVVTRDHKPDLSDERARILGAGGRVIWDGYANHRVYASNQKMPGMNMSRAFGDLFGHNRAGVVAAPEVLVRHVALEDAMLVICSDGVWEFIQPTEAAKFIAVRGGLNPDNGQKVADALAKEAWDRWIKEEGGNVVDDITVLFVYLSSNGRFSARGRSEPDQKYDFASEVEVPVHGSSDCFCQ